MSMLLLELAFWLLVAFAIVYYAVKQTKKRKQEHFEDRKN